MSSHNRTDLRAIMMVRAPEVLLFLGSSPMSPARSPAVAVVPLDGGPDALGADTGADLLSAAVFVADGLPCDGESSGVMCSVRALEIA